MANPASEVSSYLRRPLYIYDLPSEVLQSLSLRSGEQCSQQLPEEVKPPEPARNVTLSDDGVASTASCALCKSTFRDVSEQRQHVRSDFHRYNLKLSVKGLTPVDETTFIKQIGDLDESISGSDTSESDSDEDTSKHAGDSTLAALLRKQANLSRENDDDTVVVSKTKRGAGNAPLLWLSSPKIGDNVGLGVYRAILSDVEQAEAVLHLPEIVKRKQIKSIQGKQSGKAHNAPTTATTAEPHFFLCMIGGGHFAAAVIGLAAEVRKGPGGIEERHAVVRAHKTFHRYTTRRKQGGSQSANDNSKGNAHSAGSSIRRYNEAALEIDVRNVLTEWKAMIDSAELLFVRATGSTSRRTLFGPYDGQVLKTNDKRLRGFPFSTRRATQAELVRSFQELTRFKISTITETSPSETSKTESQSTSKELKPKAAAPAPPKLTPEQELALHHTAQLQNLIRRSKAPAVLLYISKNSIPSSFRFYPPDEGANHHSPTPLHLAASTNSAAVVTALLTRSTPPFDPTIQNEEGKTPYEISGDGKTRDAFRIARHDLGEMWDWEMARVPSAFSAGEAEKRAQRERAETEAAEAQRRKADLEQIKRDEERRNVGKMERKAGPGKPLTAVVEKTAEDKREEEARGLTPEMRQRLERERRARAAEARIKAMQRN